MKGEDRPALRVVDAGDGLDASVPDKLFFRIGEIAELVGVEPHVLRYWETEFRIRPQRSSSGQRMYRRKDLAKFLRIKKLLHDEGYTIAGARKALSEASPAAPVEEGPRPAVDDLRIREALDRIEQTRSRVREARDRLSRLLPVIDPNAPPAPPALPAPAAGAAARPAAPKGPGKIPPRG